jgi:hypothetical protein
MFVIHLMMAPGGPKHVVKRGSEKCQNKHSVAIAGIDLCHIYIFVISISQQLMCPSQFQTHLGFLDLPNGIF